MPADVLTILKAAEAAAKWHVGQKRKGAAAEPYINHLIEVASLVAQAQDGNDPALIAAAFLHDAVEDQNVSPATIAAMFGEDTAALVAEVTDDKSLPKAERKRLQVEKAPHKSRRAKILKLADKTSNLRAMVESPPADWPLERRREYLGWARQVVAGLGDACPSLLAQFEEAAKKAEAALDGAQGR
jgi:GTP diphosphokinase / guanosine-3',5'-bis(diphosphate) 3'-diphosphatase